MTDGGIGLGKIWQEGEGLPQQTAAARFAGYVRQAWKNVRVSPLTAVLSVITMTIALFLMGMFLLLLENVNQVVSSSQTDITLRLYLRDNAPAGQIEQLKRELQEIPEVQSVVSKSKGDALANFRAALGDKAVILDGLDQNNPLPASLEVTFKKQDASWALAKYASRYTGHPLVEEAQYRKGVLEQLASLMRLLRFGGLLAIVFMLIVTAFIISNTIKLALYAHRDEIGIMRLVGATEGFIKTPYVLEGFAQGIVGALVGLLMLYGCYAFLADVVQGSAWMQMFVPRVVFLSAPASLLLLLLGTSLGVLGSYFATRKFETS